MVEKGCTSHMGSLSNAKNPSPFTPAASAQRHVTLADGRVTLFHRIGNGAFGELFVGIDKHTNSKVAVKLEKRNASHPQLSYESRVYRLLHSENNNPVGIPKVHFFISDSSYNMLGMELCGPSLEDLFNYCGRRFSVKTVCMIAHQMIHRIEFVHSKGLLHRDIKPENFVLGDACTAHVLYLIDFGLGKLFWDRKRQTHIPFCEGKSITGTVRYCSTWTHKGFEQSRRDDMESIGFVLVYFMLGWLPWQGTMVRDPMQKSTVIGEKKNSTTLESLCKGLPEEILQYCTYCRKLGFTDRPDYDYLRGLFLQLARRHHVSAHPQESAKKGGMYSITSSMNSSRATGRGGLNGVEYDWMFDWFSKRTREKSGSPWHTPNVKRQVKLRASEIR
uniref:non-specific serine/threonine protein kinase n=1 Tax=Trypanosoma congolense (strain IL3000) TaxID=1068625 RepID=G0UJU7_TRYCI|nr:putative casein kinase 1 [Trypanosoma congolense IL3000]